jgi:hypothetical protein
MPPSAAADRDSDYCTDTATASLPSRQAVCTAKVHTAPRQSMKILYLSVTCLSASLLNSSKKSATLAPSFLSSVIFAPPNKFRAPKSDKGQ